MQKMFFSWGILLYQFLIKINGENCMDTMGHQINEGVGVFNCHGQGGNQVSLLSLFSFDNNNA